MYKLFDLRSASFVTTYIGLNSFLGFTTNRSAWFYETARLIAQNLNKKGVEIRLELNENEFTLDDFQTFLTRIASEVADKRLVIMFDDFGYSLARDFYSRVVDDLRNVLLKNKKLTIILSGHSEFDWLSKPDWKSISTTVIMLERLTSDDFPATL